MGSVRYFSFPHTAAVTPESPTRGVFFLPPHSGYTRVPPVQPGPRRDRDAPWVRQVFDLPPHSGGYTRVPPVQPGPRRDRDAPWVVRYFPHTAAVTPEFQPGPRGDRDAPWVRQVFFLPTHSGGYTRVPPVQPGPRGDRDAPWVRQVFFLPPHGGYTRVPPVQSLRSSLGRGGIGTPRGLGYFTYPHTRRLHPSPVHWAAGGWGRPVGSSSIFPCLTQRRLHPSPSGPAWGRGIGTPVGSSGILPSPTHRRLHPSPSGPTWAAEG